MYIVKIIFKSEQMVKMAPNLKTHEFFLRTWFIRLITGKVVGCCVLGWLIIFLALILVEHIGLHLFYRLHKVSFNRHFFIN